MSYIEQIHEYLEGRLSPEQERDLFDSLSADPQLRNELAFQMRMQQTVQKDISSVSIPLETTASIFSSVGIKLPKKTSLLSKYFEHLSLQHIIAGASLLATAGILSYFLLRPASEIPATSPEPSSALKSSSALPKSASQTSGRIDGSSQQNIVSAPVADSTKMHADTKGISRDLGKFSSVDYLANSKIIGVTTGGKIYVSDDGGLLWTPQQSNTTRDLFGIHFTNALHGVIVGEKGTILLTSNSGKKWKSIGAKTKANLICIRYASGDTLYACGARGTILRSTTGGLTWQKLESGTIETLDKINFENGLKGTIAGERGIVLQTVDGIHWLRSN